MSNKRLSINMAANLLAFAVNLGINFFLTPYIIKTVGTESYGFVGLANNFVNYASLLTIALNSMAGRFITINIHQNNNKEANKYFNSILLANTFIAIVLAILSIVCVFNLNQLLNVSSDIYRDVQVLFVLLFMNFIVSTIGSTFAIATFARNRLDLSSMRGIESNLLRVLLLVGLFYFFQPSIAYLGVAALAATLYVLVTNYYYTKKLVPELKIKKQFFDFKSIRELLSSGIWNTVIRLGQLLLDGIDLLIANLFVGAAAMGTLALAKTVPMFITSLVGVLAGVFMPGFTIKFAQNNIPELIKDIKQSMKIMGIFVGIPVSMLIAFGDVFYTLWTPSEDSWKLQILSIISVATIIVSGSLNTIYNVFTVTNKLKANALWLIVTGILNTIIVLVLLKTTSLGLYAIAGVSTVISILRNLIFTAPYGAKYLGAKWNTFFSEILKSVISISVTTVLALSLRLLLDIDTWVELFLFGGISAFLGLILNFFLILTKKERTHLLQLIKGKMNRGV